MIMQTQIWSENLKGSVFWGSIRRWTVNNKMNLRRTGCDFMEWSKAGHARI